jgi:deoxyribodipyrimidine photo-lyase
MNRILQRSSLHQAGIFICELCRKEYVRQIRRINGSRIFRDFLQPLHPALHHRMINFVFSARTVIGAVDLGIKHLYDYGYLHNHLRMYVASVICNIGKVNRRIPSRWMHHPLLDGDLASNAPGWPWIAGTFSFKNYFSTHDNINQYCGTSLRNTFLDFEYEYLLIMDYPEALSESMDLNIPCRWPEQKSSDLYTKPLLLYTIYNLDPEGRKSADANRAPVKQFSRFRKFPISDKVRKRMLLACRIPELRVNNGEVRTPQHVQRFPKVIGKKHPLIPHFTGTHALPICIFPEVSCPEGSFSACWKSFEKELYQICQ